MFICTWKYSIVSGLVGFLFPMGNASSRLSCFHCISGIPTYIWRVEFKVEESAFWVLLNLHVHFHLHFSISLVHRFTNPLHFVSVFAIGTTSSAYRRLFILIFQIFFVQLLYQSVQVFFYLFDNIVLYNDKK